MRGPRRRFAASSSRSPRRAARRAGRGRACGPRASPARRRAPARRRRRGDELTPRSLPGRRGRRAGRGARLPRPLAARGGGARERRASARGATPGSPRRAASCAWRASCCPRSTTSIARSRPPRPQPENADHHLTDGIRLVQSEMLAALERVGIDPRLAEGRAVRPAPPRGRRPAARRRRRERHRDRRLPARLPARRRDRARGEGRRRRVARLAWPSPTSTRPSGSTRRPRPTRSRRPTASSRASTTPTATPTTPRPRSASRRSSTPTTCCRTPTSASSTTAAASFGPFGARAAPAAAPGFDAELARATSSPNLFGGGGGAGPRPRRAARPSAAATSRPTSGSASTQSLQGVQVPAHAQHRHALPDLPRHRRQAGHLTEGLPALPGPRHRVAGPGPVLDLPAVLAVRRHRHRDRGPLRDLCRARARCRRQAAAARQHPGRRARRLARADRGQGRGRAATAAPSGDLYVSRASTPRRSSSAGARTSRSRCRSRFPRRCAAPRSRCRRSAAARRCASRPGTAHGTLQRLRGEGPPRLGGKGNGDIHYRFVIDVPDRSTPSSPSWSTSSRRR